MLKLPDVKKRCGLTDKFESYTISEMVFEDTLIDSKEERGADALPSSIPDRLQGSNPQDHFKNVNRFEEKCDFATDNILGKSAQA